MLISSYLQMYPVAFVIFMAILGLIVGSFLNVVIYRLPRMMEREWRTQCKELLNLQDKPEEIHESFNLVIPRSRCPQCNHKISALDNIPVISYLLLKGKCRICNSSISLHYPLVEMISGILTAYIAWYFGYSVQTLFAVPLTWALICLCMIDIDRQILPDDITLPFLWLGLACNMSGVFTDVYSSLIGAMAGYGVLWSMFIAFKLATGKEGMGYGDFKLFAMLGAWLGWQMLPLIILLSSMLGAVIGISLILFRKHDKNIPIPFGPYLVISGWIAMIWGDAIIAAYWSWGLPG